MRWPQGIAPSLSGIAGRLDTFVIYTQDGGASYCGFVSGEFCSGNAWSIECWLKVASYANPSPVAGNYGCRILGNDSYSEGAAQAGFDWGIWTNTVSNAYYEYCADPTRGWGFTAYDNTGIPPVNTAAHVAFTTWTIGNNQLGYII